MFGTFRVQDLMSRDPMFLRAHERLSEADELMTMDRVRHLPVLAERGDELVGIVSQRDLFRGALAQHLGINEVVARDALDELAVADVMTPNVVTVEPETPIAEAARIMFQRKIGCLPVIEDKKLVGILTEADFVAMLASVK